MAKRELSRPDARTEPVEDLVRQTFYRTNNTGQSLIWDEFHDALYGHGGTELSSLAELAASLEAVGMGRPDEDAQLLPCLVREEQLALQLRSDHLVHAVYTLGQRLAGWGRTDRPSIQYVLPLGAEL